MRNLSITYNKSEIFGNQKIFDTENFGYLELNFFQRLPRIDPNVKITTRSITAGLHLADESMMPWLPLRHYAHTHSLLRFKPPIRFQFVIK